MRRATDIVAAAALASLLAAGVAHADTPPSRWDLARDPAERARYALHVTVRELLALDHALPSRAMGDAPLERARALLEDAGAAKSPDVRLRFDLGEVYYELSHYRRAIAVLAPALALAPHHPAATDAYLTIAYAYAKLADPREEREGYRKFLARTNDDRARALALLNMAEAEMHLGNLDESAAVYRDAIATAGRLPNSPSASETATLAVWGLSVALDRAGDEGGALREARLATQMDPGEQLIGHGPNVFFVPDYEREWYLALGSTVHARDARVAEEAALAWGVVEEHWTRYVNAATPDDTLRQTWIALARAHLARAHAQKLEAQKRMGKSPPSRTTPHSPPE